MERVMRISNFLNSEFPIGQAYCSTLSIDKSMFIQYMVAIRLVRCVGNDSGHSNLVAQLVSLLFQLWQGGVQIEHQTGQPHRPLYDHPNE